MPSTTAATFALSPHSSRMLTGLAASSGIARGAAFVCSCGDGIAVPRRTIQSVALETELARLKQAVTQVEAELFQLRDETRRKLGDESAMIFDAQACLLRDPELLDAVAHRCRTENINAEAAWSDTVEALCQTFAQIDDALIRERAADLR